MLRHVKLFEGFISEVQAQVVGTSTVNIPKELEEIIQLSFALHTELDEATAAYEKKVKEAQPVLDKYDAEIMQKMKDLQASQVKVGNIVTRVMKQAGKITDSYKTLWTEALKKVNKATQKILIDLQAASKKHNPDKYWLEFEKSESEQNEGIKDIMKKGGELAKKFATWVSEVWSKLKASIDNYVTAADDLEKLEAKTLK